MQIFPKVSVSPRIICLLDVALALAQERVKFQLVVEGVRA